MFNELFKGQEIRSLVPANLSKDKIGVYKWWCKKDNLQTILEKLDIFNCADIEYNEKTQLYCFYVGQTKGKSGLYGRIRGNHICGNIRSSTLRNSVNAIINDGSVDEIKVNEFLDSCYVQWCPLDKEKINGIENTEINGYIRVLNGKGFNKASRHYNNQIEIRNKLKTLKKKVLK